MNREDLVLQLFVLYLDRHEKLTDAEKELYFNYITFLSKPQLFHGPYDTSELEI